jgi:hypothetical protein
LTLQRSQIIQKLPSPFYQNAFLKTQENGGFQYSPSLQDTFGNIGIWVQYDPIIFDKLLPRASLCKSPELRTELWRISTC